MTVNDADLSDLLRSAEGFEALLTERRRRWLDELASCLPGGTTDLVAAAVDAERAGPERAAHHWLAGPYALERYASALSRPAKGLSLPPRTARLCWPISKVAVSPKLPQPGDAAPSVPIARAAVVAGRCESLWPLLADALHFVFVRRRPVMLALVDAPDGWPALVERAVAPLCEAAALRVGTADSLDAIGGPAESELHLHWVGSRADFVRVAHRFETATALLSATRPVVVLPTLYDGDELRGQAQRIAADLLAAPAFGLSGPVALLVSEDWPQREQLTTHVRDALAAVGAESPLDEVALRAPSTGDFLEAAVEHCNRQLDGSADVTIVVHPLHEDDPETAQRLAASIDRLRYGMVGVNISAAALRAVPNAPFGAHPSGTRDAPRSGMGFTQAAAGGVAVDKVVVFGRLTRLVEPRFNLGIRERAAWLRRLVDHARAPTLGSALRVYSHAVRTARAPMSRAR